MKEYRYVIPLQPISKKNSQRILTNRGRPFIMPSEQYKRYEEAAGYFLRPKPPAPISEPVIIRYLFYMPARRRVDGLNLAAAMDDILVKYGILEDDNRNIVAGHDGSRVHLDKENPRTEIYIYPAEEDYPVWEPKRREK